MAERRLFEEIADTIRRLIADGFPHSVEDERLGDAAKIGPHRGRPVLGHVERQWSR